MNPRLDCHEAPPYHPPRREAGQADLFGGAEQGLREILQAHAEQFRADFPAWLEENGHVWARFCREADKLRAIGRKHYSARTIIEVLRHESALTDSDPMFRLNNNHAPDLARLYRLTHAGAEGFFEVRVQGGSERVA